MSVQGAVMLGIEPKCNHDEAGWRRTSMEMACHNCNACIQVAAGHEHDLSECCHASLVATGRRDLDGPIICKKCGALVPTEEQIRQLMVLVSKYQSEPDPDGSDEATERDLEYFDELIKVLLPDEEMA